MERQLREKDVHYRLKKLEEETHMRDVIMAETYSTLRDSEAQRRGGRCVSRGNILLVRIGV